MGELEPGKKASSTADVKCADEDAFEFKDYDGELVRLVKHISDSHADTYIEVFVEGVSFWKGLPTFSHDSGRLVCGDKGATVVPEAQRDPIRHYLASMPPPPVLKLDLAT